MTDYTINGLPYHVEIVGRGHPLVLLHGFTGSAATWADLVAALARSFRVVAIDLPGHGRTAAPPEPARYGMECVAADLAALLTALDAVPADWLGYSMGGRLALYTAVHHPPLVRRLLLESASPGLASAAERTARRTTDEALAARIERDGMTAFVDEWERLPLWSSQARLPESARAAQRAQRLRNSPHGLANSLRGMGTGAQPSLWNRLTDVAVPTLLIAGALDNKFVSINQRMAATLPNARLLVAPEAGHNVHLDKPQWFAVQARAFFSDEEFWHELADTNRDEAFCTAKLAPMVIAQRLQNDGQNLAQAEKDREDERGH